MKKITISTVLVCSAFFINAQQKNDPTFNDYFQKRGIFSPAPPVTSLKPLIKITPAITMKNTVATIASAKAKLSHTLPNGNKVYILPQDNMPCIVPDMQQFSMPVAKSELNGSMPNAVIPQQIIP